MRKEERCRTLLGTIYKYQTIKGVTDETIRKRIGVSDNTYRNRRTNPETFTAGELIDIYDFLGVPKEEREI